MSTTHGQASAIHLCLGLVLRKIPKKITQTCQQQAACRYEELADDVSAFPPDKIGRALGANEIDEWGVAVVCDHRFVANYRLDEAFQKTHHVVGSEFFMLAHKHIYTVYGQPGEGVILHVIPHLLHMAVAPRHTK